MESEIVREARRLYDAGKVQEALQYYVTALWRGEERNAELLPLWLGDPNLAAKAGEQAVCTFFACLLLVIDRYEEPLRRQLWALCHDVLDGMPQGVARQDTTDRYVVECNLYRHEKEFEKALEVIQKGLKQGTTASRYTFAGLTCLDLEREEEAERYLAMGYQANPDDASAYNDLGDHYVAKRRWKKAEGCYFKVLEAGDGNDRAWAEPSWLFCRFMAEGDPYELERLALYAASDENSDRARWLCRMAAFERKVPNVDYLEFSTESIVNAVRSIRERGKGGNVPSAPVRCGTSCQESASSILAVRLGLEQIYGRETSFVLSSAKVQDPPLDETLDEEGIVLWDYRDVNAPVPAVAWPSEYVSSLVRELAETDFSLPAWYEAAGRFAAQVSTEQREELYGVMVHPPKQEKGEVFAEDWLFQVQFAAVCILARTSLRELDRICKGQLDWPIIPAFTLAAWLASQDVSCLPWAEDLMGMVQSRISKENYCFFEHAYACAAGLLPGREAAYYTEVWRWRQSLKEG